MQERHQLNKIKVQWAEQLYVRFEAWYISSPSSAEKKTWNKKVVRIFENVSHNG